MATAESEIHVKGWAELNPTALTIVPTNLDEILAHAYLRFRGDGLLQDIFSEGETTLTWFLQTYSQMAVVGAFRGESLAGLGWITKVLDMGPAGRKAEVGMAFFPEVAFAEKLELGRMMIAWAFETQNLGGLYGTTPAPHSKALAYAKLLGFELFGPIPGLSAWRGERCGAYVSAMTKERWEQRRAL
jgi:hypothetical protein